MPSPTPMNRNGRPRRCLTATTQPPFAVPSSLVRIMPVSYTHLDVYKRQAHDAFQLNAGLFLVQLTALEIALAGSLLSLIHI